MLLSVCKLSAQNICNDVLSTNNRLLNGSFESGTSNWSTTAGSVSNDSYYMMCGTTAGVFTPNVSGQEAILWQRINGITSGTPLTLKGYAGTHPAGLVCSPRMELAFFNSGNVLLARRSTNITTNVDVAPYKPGLHSVSHIAPPGTSYVRVEFRVSCDWLKLDAFSLLVNNALLPLQLTSFAGTSNNGHNVLNWITENEVNVIKFEIESSVDGTQFTTIGSVESSTNPQVKNNYTFKHFNFTEAKNFYRLKMIDKDGSYSYSKVIAMNNKASNVIISTFPNPFVSNINLQWNSSKNEMVVAKLISSTGKLLYTETKFVQKGINTINFNGLSSLPNGIYITELYSDGVKIAANKIAKN